MIQDARFASNEDERPITRHPLADGGRSIASSKRIQKMVLAASALNQAIEAIALTEGGVGQTPLDCGFLIWPLPRHSLQGAG